MSKSNQPRFVRVTEDTQSTQFELGPVEMIPKLLVERFGKPSPGDGDKVSGEFVFAGSRGEVYCVHDWKMTGSHNFGLSSDAFWDLDEITPLQIRGWSHSRTSVETFVTWLSDILSSGSAADQEWLASLTAESYSGHDMDRLLHLLEFGGTMTQAAAAETICRIGASLATPTLLQKLLGLLCSEHRVHLVALKALSAFAELSHMNWVQSRVLEQLNSGSAKARCNGLSALKALGAQVWSGAVLSRVAELIVEEATAHHALKVMGVIGQRGTLPPSLAVISGVAMQLKSPDRDIRRAAAWAVTALGQAAAVLDVLTPLFRMLGETDFWVRDHAETSFKKIGKAAAVPGLLAHLCRSVRPKDFPVQASALRVARNIAKATGELDAGRRLEEIIRCSRPGDLDSNGPGPIASIAAWQSAVQRTRYD